MNRYEPEPMIDIEIRSKLFDTLERLSLYKPEPSWEDFIMKAYEKSLQNFGSPGVVLINPKALQDLKKIK